MSAFLTIDPRDMDVLTWTAQMVPNLIQFGPVPSLFTPEDWRQWGLSILSLQSLSGVNMPDPTLYDNWRLWAAELNVVLETR